MHEDLETQLENQNEESIAGGLPVDLTACAAARHLMQEGLKARLENQTMKVSSAVSPWISRRAHLTQEGLKIEEDRKLPLAGSLPSAISPETSRHAQRRGTSCTRV